MLSNTEISELEAELERDLIESVHFDHPGGSNDDELSEIRADVLAMCNSKSSSASKDISELPGFELFLHSTRTIGSTRKDSSDSIHEINDVLVQSKTPFKQKPSFDPPMEK